jgi:hypothetical protein
MLFATFKFPILLEAFKGTLNKGNNDLESMFMYELLNDNQRNLDY